MPGYEPAPLMGPMPECERIALQWTRLIIGALMLGAVIAGLLV